MNREMFLRLLRQGLDGLPPAEIDEILADYAQYFDEARAGGRTEENVAAALGDPRRLARELRAESGLRRWESERSLGSFAGALLALAGLAAVDLVFLLPLLALVAFLALILALMLAVIAAVGIGLVLSLLHFGSLPGMLVRGFAGLGLLSGSLGGGALLLLALAGALRLLGRYARLHYRLLKPVPHAV
ncbi:MAG TPA: DUF1700 domain-containing protein [Stellaceae bacterium]|nr:DUF1700 domain-containing protein [Stellaceae bacterium]